MWFGLLPCDWMWPVTPGGADANGAIFKKAGETFDVSVSAVQYVAGQDSDNNGQPDANANLSANPVTPSFGREATPEGATVSNTLLSPVGGNNPTVANSQFSAFTNAFMPKPAVTDSVLPMSASSA